jgi:hypothetical protein
MGTAQLVREVVKALEKKTQKTTNRASLDALVYMNLGGRHLYPAPDVIEDDTSVVAQLGWRSVSVLWPPYAVVICAQPPPRASSVPRREWSSHPGVPWEKSASPPKTGSLAQLAGDVSASLAILGYVALGGLSSALAPYAR